MKLWAAGIVLLCAGITAGDVIRMRDGTVVEGAATRAEGGWLVTRPDGSSVMALSVDIESVELSQPPATSPSPPATTPDPTAIIALADEARRMLKDARFREAEALIKQILEIDPSNPSGYYLNGLLAWRRERIPTARRSFEVVLDAMPDHVPSLNNLAIVLWRQNLHAAAMLSFDHAMEASPMDRAVLDNVAAAIAALPEKAKTSSGVRRAITRFEQQDADLQERMNRAGLYRWGAQWVDRTRYEALQADRRQVEGRLDDLDRDIARVEAAIADLDEQTAYAEQEMHRIQNRQYVRDREGRDRMAGLPSTYQRHRENAVALGQERARAYAALEALHGDVEAVRQKVPAPQSGGDLRLIDVEGTPLLAD
jgi:Tfp pilus assembly protein PilF